MCSLFYIIRGKMFFSFFLLLPLKFVCGEEPGEEVLVEVATRSLEQSNNPPIFLLPSFNVLVFWFNFVFLVEMSL